MDTLIINEKRLQDLPELLSKVEAKGVRIYADAQAYKALKGKYTDDLLEKADEETWSYESMSLQMGVKTVANIDEALEHIAKYGSGHSESIITEDQDAQKKFQTLVDAACVYVNTPTSFTDGAQFGLGAEIGISTQKLGARGPMALEEITTYKWLITGHGQIRA